MLCYVMLFVGSEFELTAVQPLARQTNFTIELQSNWAVDQLPYGERNPCTPPQNSKDPLKDPRRY